MYDYDQEDPTFPEDLENSFPAAHTIAGWLNRQGKEAIVMPKRLRRDWRQMNEIEDWGDIGTKEGVVEAKHRPTLHFTSKESFPFPTIIVDRCHNWDKAVVKPICYYLANAPMTHCFSVHKDTFPHWTKTLRWDKKGKREVWHYDCPIELTEIHDMREKDAVTHA